MAASHSNKQRQEWWQRKNKASSEQRKQRFLKLESLESRELLIATPVTFDFGTTSSPVLAGAVQVLTTSTYSAANEYGWQSLTTPTSGDAGSSLPEDRRDYVGGTAGTFAVDLANGTYDVTVGTGKANVTATLSLEGAQVDSLFLASTDPFLPRTYRVDVADGQLNLSWQSPAGKSWVVNAIKVESASTAPTVAPRATPGNAAANPVFIVPTMGLKPSPSGESFRFFGYSVRLCAYGALPYGFA